MKRRGIRNSNAARTGNAASDNDNDGIVSQENYVAQDKLFLNEQSMEQRNESRASVDPQTAERTKELKYNSIESTLTKEEPAQAYAASTTPQNLQQQ